MVISSYQKIALLAIWQGEASANLPISDSLPNNKKLLDTKIQKFRKER